MVCELITAKDELKLAEADTSKTSFEAANDSWLDSSETCNFKIKTKNKGAGNGNDDDDADDIVSGKEYVPAKGQKMAAARLKKIQGLLSSRFVSFSPLNFPLKLFCTPITTATLQKGLVDTEKIENKRKSKAPKTSPPKRAQQTARRPPPGRRGRRNYVELDDMDSDSDLDEPAAAQFVPARNARRHDSNTIVLDCDDVFAGGPAVNFTRDIAGANAVSVEQSQEMKVTVRINNKVEQFRMNPVSC